MTIPRALPKAIPTLGLLEERNGIDMGTLSRRTVERFQSLLK